MYIQDKEAKRDKKWNERVAKCRRYINVYDLSYFITVDWLMIILI